MAQESGTASIYQAAHHYLILHRVETVEKFFERDKDQIKKQLLYLGLVLFNSEGDWRKTVLALAAEDNLDAYKQLIETILLNEATSNETMLRLINEIAIQTSTLPLASTSGTGRTVTQSGRVNASHIASEVVHTIKQELNKLLYNDVPGLVEHFIDPVHTLTHRERNYNSFIDNKRNEKLPDMLEGTILEYISSFAKELVNQEPPEIPMSRSWQTRPRQHLTGANGICMVDGAIMCGLNKYEADNDIRDVLVPFELKKEAQHANHAVICLAKYVSEIQIWQFDRSGAIGSKPFDFKSNKADIEKFLYLMSCFLTCDKELLGFDPTFIEAQDLPTVIQTQDDQKFEIDPEIVFQAPGICGRGTTCWKAHLSGDKSQEFLIKDSWQPEHRRAEGEMLQEVTEHNVPHVARHHYHETVRVNDEIVDISSHVRRRVALQDDRTIDTKEEPDNSNVPNVFINWFHRRLILKDVGKPIWTVGAPLRLLQALEDCIVGHQGLLRAGYLHRDISVNNLMVNDQAVDPNYRSFLIDLEVALKLPTSNNDVCRARTGTKVFMSANLLRGEHPHACVDDIESFFWVLVWICIHHPNNQRQGTSKLANWNQQPPIHLAGIKHEYLRKPVLLTEHFTHQYSESQALLDCVAEFASVIKEETVRNLPHESLYTRILQIIQQAQTKLCEEGRLREEEKLREEGRLCKEKNKSRPGTNRREASEQNSSMVKKRKATK
ncbi:hypothetical protein, variant [Puccinia striiformis f. sp. tritici PST-78]|uniref:Fungal-type protein kinase domain-containing protein n=2 Tax=Puccinia striiformis f. sp. tritici TaxID=168172 RepID=A0A0L0W191_9BASI|nr:hypothetical protein PSTG_01459 [Puccinia striiformis f. sp. tritici PST-78]KNF05243.1 hypothetical protein, variant [Puccinia striiformis f. sp. tritici PST-78]